MSNSTNNNLPIKYSECFFSMELQRRDQKVVAGSKVVARYVFSVCLNCMVEKTREIILKSGMYTCFKKLDNETDLLYKKRVKDSECNKYKCDKYYFVNVLNHPYKFEPSISSKKILKIFRHTFSAIFQQQIESIQNSQNQQGEEKSSQKKTSVNNNNNNCKNDNSRIDLLKIENNSNYFYQKFFLPDFVHLFHEGDVVLSNFPLLDWCLLAFKKYNSIHKNKKHSEVFSLLSKIVCFSEKISLQANFIEKDGLMSQYCEEMISKLKHLFQSNQMKSIASPIIQWFEIGEKLTKENRKKYFDSINRERYKEFTDKTSIVSSLKALAEYASCFAEIYLNKEFIFQLISVDSQLFPVDVNEISQNSIIRNVIKIYIDTEKKQGNPNYKNSNDIEKILCGFSDLIRYQITIFGKQATKLNKNEADDSTFFKLFTSIFSIRNLFECKILLLNSYKIDSNPVERHFPLFAMKALFSNQEIICGRFMSTSSGFKLREVWPKLDLNACLNLIELKLDLSSNHVFESWLKSLELSEGFELSDSFEKLKKLFQRIVDLNNDFRKIVNNDLVYLLKMIDLEQTLPDNLNDIITTVLLILKLLEFREKLVDLTCEINSVIPQIQNNIFFIILKNKSHKIDLKILKDQFEYYNTKLIEYIEPLILFFEYEIQTSFLSRYIPVFPSQDDFLLDDFIFKEKKLIIFQTDDKQFKKFERELKRALLDEEEITNIQLEVVKKTPEKHMNESVEKSNLTTIPNSLGNSTKKPKNKTMKFNNNNNNNKGLVQQPKKASRQISNANSSLSEDVSEKLEKVFDSTKCRHVSKGLNDLLKEYKIQHAYTWGKGDHLLLCINGRRIPLPEHKEWKRGTAHGIQKVINQELIEQLEKPDH